MSSNGRPMEEEEDEELEEGLSLTGSNNNLNIY
jgi:hypothetical protein